MFKEAIDKEATKVLASIAKGKPVSASRHWVALGVLQSSGKLTARRTDNGQIEYLYDGKPVQVGP